MVNENFKLIEKPEVEEDLNKTPPKKKSKVRSKKGASSSTNKKIVKKTVISLDSENLSKKHSQKQSENASDRSVKFPLKKFLSASTENEEDMLIEHYSMQLRSISNANNLPLDAQLLAPDSKRQLKKAKKVDLNANEQYQLNFGEIEVGKTRKRKGSMDSENVSKSRQVSREKKLKTV